MQVLYSIVPCLLVFSIVLLSDIKAAAIDADNNSTTSRGFSRDCTNSYSTTCLKLDIVSFVEKLTETKSYQLLPGVSVVRDESSSEPRTADLVAELARDFPNDPEARLDTFLFRKIEGYLNSHSIQLKLMDKKSIEAARSMIEEGRRKKGNMATNMLAGMMMVKGMLLPMGMGALAMLAGKALMTGLMSLMLSAIVGLKSMGGGMKTATYEIISKPVYTQSHSHSSSHEDVHGGGGYGGGGGHGGYHRRSYPNDVPYEIPQEYYKTN